ncbi:formylglycine-generating enzyme family protein [Leptothoe kymatousa]|uniref:Formylglycine-generating enzyme family protein n=1 Tax=Leptothoe kymatousa TAU-MAC 1615 TaxID=2364775 RepID=A0ABS5XYZ9_9CYAN|nr:formylglycine-generating enzyme family protein [Leptothoe kymatousa]MBT9310826.1 formylglycine-generating enzyme family protein [Leptothoe kymatousa TAU-MAC 1615]
MVEPKLLREQRQTRYFVEQLSGEVSIDMIRVPGGTFLMGSPDDELDRRDTEGPQHEVSVPTFFMGRYPVTQAQWKAVTALPQVEHKLNAAPYNFKGDNRPVEQVSWYEAVEFCTRLSAHTGREYRLPSEAEWEYACRAGTQTPFYFGETITTEIANYRGTDDGSLGWSGSYGQGPKGEYRQETTPVDHFNIANAFGLCDMHGNVDEWCQDHWHDNYQEAPNDGSVWLTNNEDSSRVVRGGSWGTYPRNCLSASRHVYTPDYRYYRIGFRVVCRAPLALAFS